MKVLVLGNFGFKSNKLDGQTVKSREVYHLLKSKLGDKGEVYHLDTNSYHNKFLIFPDLFKHSLRCQYIVYLPAQNSLRFIFPFIFFLSFFFKTKIILIAIGGWLDVFIERRLFHTYALKKIKAILVETQALQKSLSESFKLLNVAVFPNFRTINFFEKYSNAITEPLSLVYIGRVNYLKGVNHIFNLERFLLNHEVNNARCQIDIYGQIDKEYKNEFDNQLIQSILIKYKGEVNPRLIPDTLSKYDLLLFPTRYYTEGCPGVIVDACIAGIPVIATQWKHAHEFIYEGVTGNVIPFDSPDHDLQRLVLYYLQNKEALKYLKARVSDYRHNYSADFAWEILKSKML